MGKRKEQVEGTGGEGEARDCPASPLPQVLPDGLTGDLQDNHGGVKLPQGLDG